MKKMMAVVMCLVCFLAGFVFTAETKAAGDGPVIELFESSVDIGIIPDEIEEITGQIIIFNKGTEDLKILKVTGPCSCFKGYDGDKVIEPDGNGLINVHFDKNAIPAGKITRKAILTTNDPAKKQVTILFNFIEGELKGYECAGINRIGIEIESVLRGKFSQLLRPSAEGRLR